MGQHGFKFNAGVFPLPQEAIAVALDEPLDRLTVNSDWQQLPSTLDGDFQVQVTEETPVEIAISADKPTGSIGEVLAPLKFYAVVLADSSVWVRCVPPQRTSEISITGVDISDPVPATDRAPRFANGTPVDVYSSELPTFTAELDVRDGPANKWWWTIGNEDQPVQTSAEGQYEGFELELTEGSAPISVTLTCVNILDDMSEKTTRSHVAWWYEPQQYDKPAYSNQYA